MKNIILIFITICFAHLSFGQSIFEAIEKNNYARIEELLNTGEETEQYGKKGQSPLWIATYKNDTTLLKILIAHKADLNFPDKRGTNAIVIGCLTDSYESVKVLLANGVNVNWKGPSVGNQQPIRFASQGGSLRLVKLLLSHGADMESTPNDKATPLLAALHAKNFEVAKFYFENGANVNVVGRDGETIIHEAIKTKNPEMVELSIKFNAPLSYKDPTGKSTWQLAKQSGNSTIKKMVKEALN